jgi:basic membrane protein A
MKKLVTLFVLIAVAAACLAITGSALADPFKVVYLVNGNLGDKGFYDSCAEGVKKLSEEYGVETKIIEMGRDEAAYESYFRDVSEQDWDVIIAATWSVLEQFEEVAQDYPDQHYIFLDGNIGTPNMIGITYKSNHTGFMAGALAALMLDVDDPKINKDNRTLGFIGSVDTTNINDFMIGYAEGIKYIDPTIHMLSAYVGSFEDVATCLEMTTQLYNQGAEIVYTPTSQSQLGAVTASSDVDKYMITCDTDVYEQMVDADANLVRNLLSSSLKKAGESIVYAVTGVMDGTLEWGENYDLGLATDTVGLANDANYQALVPEEIRTRLEEIAQDVIDGKIEVSSAYVMTAEEVAAVRDGMKP